MIELLISTGTVCEMVKISPSDTAHRFISTYRPKALGSGISRDVYKLSDRLVLKVANGCEGYGIHDNANANEIALWESLSESERDSGTFARIFAYAEDSEWIISELIPYIGEGWSNQSADNRELIRKYEVSDLHGDNYGMREDGSFAILDYGANSEGSSGSVEMCECFACSCRKCHPEGCECEPFEGCHYHAYRCAVCSAAADAADRLAHCGDLPTVARNKARAAASELRQNYANQTAAVLWSGDTSEEHSVRVCGDCADAEDLRRHVERFGPEPDMEQGILNFGNRYAVGCEARSMWTRSGFVTRIFWFVRDRFILDNTGAEPKRKYGRPVSSGVVGHEGYSEALALCEDLNNGLHSEHAARIARL